MYGKPASAAPCGGGWNDPSVNISPAPAEPTLDDLAQDPGRAAALPAEVKRAVTLRCLTILVACAADAGAAAPPPPPPVEEQYVTAEAGARLLGVSRRWLYRNKRRLPFVRSLSRKVLQVSLPALRRWQQAQRPR
jgi:hypothetical protein